MQDAKRSSVNSDLTRWPDAARRAYEQAGYWWGKPLLDILRRQRDERPDGIALIDGDEQMSYVSLDAAAARLAAVLHARGLEPGDHAVVQLPNGIPLYVTYWALLKLGVRAVFALFSHGSHELDAFCAQLEPQLFVASRRSKLFAGGYRPAAPILIHGDDLVETSGGDSFELPSEPADGSTVAFFQLSGGSTSTPKLIPRTHDDYYYSVRRSAEICSLTPQTVYLCGLPGPHNFPLSSPGVLGVWYAGGTVVVAPDPSPAACFPLIERYGVTMTSLVPPMVPLWLDAAKVRQERLTTLSLLQVGGAKLPDAVAQRIEPELGCRLQQVFGMAEGLVCYTRLDDDDWHRFNTQGQPMSVADEIKIVDDDGEPVPVGTVGHLMTRGPYTVRGYFRAAEHNARVFDADGFYSTGDLVMQTPSGHLVVAGREKDQINRGGEKIAAAEVENLLLTFEGLLQAAVVAMPDDALGEKSCAFLVCRDAMPKPHELRRHLRLKGIADFKLPDRFVLVAALPLTPVGKPDKSLLRRMVATNAEDTAHGHP